MTNRTALIPGASIAGPALAFWLSRQGYAVTVVERSRELRGGRQRPLAVLTGAFAGGGWRLPELMERVKRSDDVYLDSIARVTMDGYSAGRVALLGDAAYGNTPWRLLHRARDRGRVCHRGRTRLPPLRRCARCGG